MIMNATRFDMTPGSLLRHFRIFGFVKQNDERLLGGMTRAEFADYLARRAICDVSVADLERIERNAQTMPRELRLFLAPHYSAIRETAPHDLRAIRESLGWSQERLAIELEISRELVSKCEAGERSLPPEAEAILRRTVPKPESGTTGQGYAICTNEIPCFKGLARGEKGGSETFLTTTKAA